MVQEPCFELLGCSEGWIKEEVPMFGLGKRKESVELVEVLPQDEETIAEVWGVDMSQNVVWETVCAWCLAEQGVAPDQASSHGICAFHRAQALSLYRKRKVHL